MPKRRCRPLSIASSASTRNSTLRWPKSPTNKADRLRGLLPDLLDRTSTGSDLEQLEHGPVLAEVQSAIDLPALENAAALLAGLAQPSWPQPLPITIGTH